MSTPKKSHLYTFTSLGSSIKTKKMESLNLHRINVNHNTKRNHQHAPSFTKVTVIPKEDSGHLRIMKSPITRVRSQTPMKPDCFQNPLIKYALMPDISKMKYLDQNTIDSMLTSCYLKTEPKSKMIINPKLKIKHRSQPRELTPTKTETDFYEEPKVAKTNRLLSPNIIKTNQEILSKSRNKINNINSIQTTDQATGTHSMINRYLLKLINNNDYIENYINEEYPKNKYKRWKVLLEKEKDKIEKIFSEIKKNQHFHKESLKLYTSMVRRAKYSKKF